MPGNSVNVHASDVLLLKSHLRWWSQGITSLSTHTEEDRRSERSLPEASLPITGTGSRDGLPTFPGWDRGHSSGRPECTHGTPLTSRPSIPRLGWHSLLGTHPMHRAPGEGVECRAFLACLLGTCGRCQILGWTACPRWCSLQSPWTITWEWAPWAPNGVFLGASADSTFDAHYLDHGRSW